MMLGVILVKPQSRTRLTSTESADERLNAAHLLNGIRTPLRVVRIGGIASVLQEGTEQGTAETNNGVELIVVLVH